MSKNHRNGVGHFGRTVIREVSRFYGRVCPSCGGYACETDHILALDFHEYAKDFGLDDIHSMDNAWRICTACHYDKNIEERKLASLSNRKDFVRYLNRHYNKWYGRAFRNGERIKWTGPVDLKAIRAAFDKRQQMFAERTARRKEKKAA